MAWQWTYLGIEYFAHNIRYVTGEPEFPAVSGLMTAVDDLGYLTSLGQITEAGFDGYAARRVINAHNGFVGDQWKEDYRAKPVLVISDSIAWQAGAGVAGSPETVIGWFLRGYGDYAGVLFGFNVWDTPVDIDTVGEVLAVPFRVLFGAP